MTKVIYMTRHGQSQNNLLDVLGGDCDITEKGRAYSKYLYQYFKSKNLDKNIRIFTSNLKRTHQTAYFFDNNIKKTLPYLNEINAGIFENKSYQYVKENHPHEYNLRKKDKFNYRYPKGESYQDLQNRVLKVFNELNYNQNSLIICHNAVLRVLYAKLLNLPKEEIPYIKIPLHTLFKFELLNNEYKVTLIDLNKNI